MREISEQKFCMPHKLRLGCQNKVSFPRVFKNLLLTVKYQMGEIRRNLFKSALTRFEAPFCDILNLNWYFSTIVPLL